MSQIIQQRIATALGNFGLVPFFTGAVATWIPFEARFAHWIELALIGYGAVILSFLGAVHWGLALQTPQMSKSQAWNAYGWGIVPALLGWLALMMALAGVPTWLVLLFLVGDLVLCRLMDGALMSIYPAPPEWYMGLRTRLTAGGAVALLIALPAKL